MVRSRIILPTLAEKLPATIQFSVLADYRKASVGDRCVRKKRNCMTLGIHFRKNIFSHFRN